VSRLHKNASLIAPVMRHSITKRGAPESMQGGDSEHGMC